MNEIVLEKNPISVKGIFGIHFTCPECQGVGFIPDPRAINSVLFGGKIDLECQKCKARLLIDNNQAIAVPVVQNRMVDRLRKIK